MTVVGDRPSVGAAGRQRRRSFKRKKGLEAVVWAISVREWRGRGGAAADGLVVEVGEDPGADVAVIGGSPWKDADGQCILQDAVLCACGQCKIQGQQKATTTIGIS